MDTADVPRRGWRHQAVPPDELWRTVTDATASLIARDGNPLADLHSCDAAGDRLWLNLVPFEKNIEFESGGQQFAFTAA